MKSEIDHHLYYKFCRDQGGAVLSVLILSLNSGTILLLVSNNLLLTGINSVTNQVCGVVSESLINIKTSKWTLNLIFNFSCDSRCYFDCEATIYFWWTWLWREHFGWSYNGFCMFICNWRNLYMSKTRFILDGWKIASSWWRKLHQIIWC